MNLASLYGVQIRIDPYWPKKPDKYYSVRFDVHPIIHWLAKFLPIQPWIDAEYQQDADPIYFNGMIFCGSQTAKIIKEQIK